MSAGGHLLVALGADGEEGFDRLWEFVDEAGRRLSGKPDGCVVVHALHKTNAYGQGLPRYCVHPTGEDEIEFRDDSLREALRKAASWLVAELPSTDLWRRE